MTPSSRIIICLVALTVAGQVRSHSWIACSDYTEKNGADWDPNKCRGYPRDASRFAQKNSFGQDRGFDYKPGAEAMGCKTTYSAGSYSAEYPKAVYFPGQQVVIVHPMKNHGADAGCTNIYIPDNANKIYRGRKDTDTDRSFSYYRNILVADLGVSPVGNAHQAAYPKRGYQNAPHFCKNTDRAMGTYSFNIPENIQPGKYTFLWRWSFNGPDDHYTTCFDVEIAANKAARDSVLSSRGVSNHYVPCGGETSDGGVGSRIGCDGGPPAPTNPPQTPRPTTVRPPPQPTTPRVTVAPTQGPDGSVMKPINIFQMTGDVLLGPPRNGVTRRYIMVHFDCPVQASFWNARLTLADNGHYELIQENPEHIRSGVVFYTANFQGSCNAAFVPHAKLVRDE